MAFLFNSLCFPTVADSDLEVRSSRMVQCIIVYLSARPDLWIRSHHCLTIGHRSFKPIPVQRKTVT